MTKQVKQITINGKHWARDSFRDYETGSYCAVGFYAKEAGILKTLRDDEDIFSRLQEYSKVSSKNFNVFDRIVHANDKYENNALRMATITRLFKTIGVRVHYKNIGKDTMKRYSYFMKHKDRHLATLESMGEDLVASHIQ